jgi:2-oxoisovalerate dehydrogenase E1 component alpha subunit
LDPLPRFQSWLEERDLLSAKALEEMQQLAAQEVDEATEYAENAAKPAPESALDRVFVE